MFEIKQDTYRRNREPGSGSVSKLNGSATLVDVKLFVLKNCSDLNSLWP